MANIYKRPLLENLLREAEDCGVFSDKTNAPSFDNIIKEDLYHYVVKQVRGEVTYMSPDEYLKAVTELQDSSEAMQQAIIQKSKVNELLHKMRHGVKLDMPYLSHVGYGGQEGRHRVAAAKEYGCESIPVAVFKSVHDKEIVRLAIELEHLDDHQAIERLTQKGFKNVTDYDSIKYSLDRILQSHDAPTEGSLRDKIGEWSDTFDGRGVSALVKYQFNDYKDEMKFIEIYDNRDPDSFFLDKALDFKLGRSYEMLQFDEYRIQSKKMDLGKYSWEGKLPKRLLDYTLTILQQHQESLEGEINPQDHEQIISTVDQMKQDIPELQAVYIYLQKMLYGCLRYDAIRINSDKLSFHTRKIRVAIGDKGATVAISNDIIIDGINEYQSGHELLVKAGLIHDLNLGFKKLEDIKELDPETIQIWFKKYGLDRI